MKISCNWLKQYLDFSQSPEDVAAILTAVGLEVEAVEPWQSVRGGLQGLVIGRVQEVIRHPDADKLTVTKVDVGTAEYLQIVCGAPNVAAGQKVIVARAGTTVHPVTGEPFQIKKARIRGIDSEGMICAADEISLGDDHSGILVLAADAPVGALAAAYMAVETDVIFDIGLTPNRGDAMSHVGVARDLAAWLQLHKKAATAIRLPETAPRQGTSGSPLEIVVEDFNGCLRYSGLVMKGITVTGSPDWLRHRLLSIGLRPINNVVDIGNYVMWECGQPLHMFDLAAISGNRVIVKTLPAGTPFRTLDDKEIKLAADDLMICNEETPMCMAGVYGGIHSGVSESTQDLFIESACFHPQYIRRTSTRHQLRTDAASHFEKGTDPNQTVRALQRAAQLIHEICHGMVASPEYDWYPQKAEAKTILLSWEKLNRVAGTAIPQQEAKTVLQSLGFTLEEETAHHLTVVAPTFKTDVTMQEDVMEEILRIYDLNRIPMPAAVRSGLMDHAVDEAESIQQELASMLTGTGFREMINNSISSSRFHEQFGNEIHEAVQLLSFSNAGLDALRTSMLFPALEVIRYNHNRKLQDLKLFEFGKTYLKENNGYRETTHLVLLVTGNVMAESWTARPQPADLFYLKGVVKNVLNRSGISSWQTVEFPDPRFEYGITLSGKQGPLVSLGKVSPQVCQAFDIRRETYYADISMDALQGMNRHEAVYEEPARYPAVRRDLALIMDHSVSFADVEELARKSAGHLLKEVNLFDVYTDEKLGAGKKSYAVGFLFVEPSKTLTDEEIDRTMKRLVRSFEETLKAQIRS